MKLSVPFKILPDNFKSPTPEEIQAALIRSGVLVEWAPGKFKIQEPEYKVLDYISILPTKPIQKISPEQYKAFCDIAKLGRGLVLITPKAL